MRQHADLLSLRARNFRVAGVAVHIVRVKAETAAQRKRVIQRPANFLSERRIGRGRAFHRRNPHQRRGGGDQLVLAGFNDFIRNLLHFHSDLSAGLLFAGKQ